MSRDLVLRLVRVSSSDQGTAGVLYGPDGEEICRMTELPWRDNARGRSRIPAGLYEVAYMERSASGKYHDVYHVLGVPERAGILIHPGNWAGDRTLGYRSDSWGCLLPCSKHGVLLGQFAGLASRSALARIHAITDRKGFILQIQDEDGGEA